jgi:hypothetical protein
MKASVLVVLILLCCVPRIQAQDSTASSTRFERIAYVLGGSLVFSLADYLAYNKLRDNERWPPDFHAPFVYRVVQTTVQAAISYVLYKKLGLPSTIAFNVMWWSWFDDLLYYGWSYALDPVIRWPNRPDPHDNLRGPRLVDNAGITWAGWTPVGLLRPPKDVIAGNTLIAQSMTGAAISIAIIW